MDKKAKETIFVLTKSDLDRIEAAIGLMRLVIRELISARRTRVNCEVHSPSAAAQVDRYRDAVYSMKLGLTF